MAKLTDEESAALLYDWTFWARPNQLPPTTDWYIWLLLSGRGYGKTRALTELVRSWAYAGYSPIALVGQTKADVRDTIVELGESSILKVSPPWFMPEYEPSKRRLTWPNGVQAIIYSGDEPDQLRGPQHCFIAGTMISTPDGDKPIETLRNGDYVLTRLGARRIKNCFSRVDRVGKVAFSNGADLVATAQHPVLQLQGWTRIGDLEKGAIVCTGEKLLTDISQPIPIRKRFTSIGGYGSSISGLFRRAIIYITKTVINKTMPLETSKSYYPNSTLLNKISKGIEYLLNAWIAALNLSVFATTPAKPYVSLVNRSVNTKEQRSQRPASFVGRCLELQTTATTVVSVVSTWEDAGKAKVYNIQVDDPPEYIANSIIVHNSKAAVDELAKYLYPQQTWDNLMMGLRVGDNPQAVIATTPRPIKILKDLVHQASIDNSKVVVTRGHTLDNRENLAPQFLAHIMEQYKGTRLGRQELAGELLDSWEGLVYDAFKQDQCIIPRFAIPDDWPRYFGEDFGTVNTAGVWFAMEPATGFLYCYRTYRAKASVIEHVKEFTVHPESYRRRVGGNHQEQNIREAYTLAGWPLAEPVFSNDRKARFARVNSLHAHNRVYYFSDLHEIIDEKTSFSYEIDRDEAMTEKIHNEAQYHLMSAESYSLSEIQPITPATTTSKVHVTVR